jgi:hypothetical protein
MVFDQERKIYNFIKIINEDVIKKLPHYIDFKSTDETKYTVNNNSLTTEEKERIEKIIDENRYLFGYIKDYDLILKYIIKYSTECTDVVSKVRNLNWPVRQGVGLFFTGIGQTPEAIQGKLDKVINFFYYYPTVTEHLGYSLEKFVGVPLDWLLKSDEFDWIYKANSNIIYKKNGKIVSGMIKNVKNKQNFTVMNLSDGKDEELNEKDIVGFAMSTNPGYGIISHIFTNENISSIEDNCKTIGEKCDETSTLAKRNSVICSLKNGARKINTSDPEINICTECTRQGDMSATNVSSVTTDRSATNDSSTNDMSAIQYLAQTGRFEDDDDEDDERKAVSGDNHRPSFSSTSTDNESTGTNMTTLTDEESQAYDTFKEVVCKTNLEERDRKLKDELTKSRALQNRNDILQSELRKKDEKITALEANKGKFSLGVKRLFTGKTGGKKKSSTKKKRKNVTRRKKKYGKKSKKSRK